ncbi:MAG TPA: hypothetical protein VK395_35740 [Gemmataceae bacterium]|nr:hypothetical protein [Gemmataceae bacterium]
MGKITRLPELIHKKAAEAVTKKAVNVSAYGEHGPTKGSACNRRAALAIEIV